MVLLLVHPRALVLDDLVYQVQPQNLFLQIVGVEEEPPQLELELVVVAYLVILNLVKDFYLLQQIQDILVLQCFHVLIDYQKNFGLDNILQI